METITTQINDDGTVTVFRDGEMYKCDNKPPEAHVARVRTIRKLNRLGERDKLIARLKATGSDISEYLQSGW